MITILKLLKECNTFHEFVAELTKRGLTGNPMTNLNNSIALWRSLHSDSFVDNTLCVS
jgi:hypothetical protein